MNPYYHEDGIKIYQGDCRYLFAEIGKDNFFDLTITSPPYNGGGKNLGYQPNSTVGQSFYDEYSDNLPPAEYEDFIMHCFFQTLQLSRYSFWNLQYLSATRGIFSKMFCETPADVFIWQKQAQSQIVGDMMAKGFEMVLMFGPKSAKFPYNNFPANGYVPNIKTWYKSEFFPEHHATFPYELPAYFIQHFTKPGDLIFDPFMGTGTTLLAAKRLGRRAVGIDISKKYCDLAIKRVSQMEMNFECENTSIK